MSRFLLPRGALIVIVSTFLIHLLPFDKGLTLLKATMTHANNLLYATAGYSMSFLLFPLIGLMSDLVFTRYKVIKAGFLIMSAGTFFAAVYGSVDSFLRVNYSRESILLVLGALIVFAICFSFGMIEANSLQFGMDQLTEASGEQLSRFVHWYYWVMQLGELTSVVLGLGVLYAISLIFGHNQDIMLFSIEYIIPVLACGIVLLSLSVALLLCGLKKYLNTARMVGNPIKNIFFVLKYSCEHKCPENRSAFTYWEEDIPKRIDLGKRKYGGPFTNEEVEDVKIFLNILPLLLSLFGQHFVGDSFSLSQQLEIQLGCPKIHILLIAVPLMVPLAIVIAAIPLYQTSAAQRVIKFLKLTMTRRLWIGLVCSVLQGLSELVIFRANVQNWDANPSTLFHLLAMTNNGSEELLISTFVDNSTGLPSMFMCFILQFENQSFLQEHQITYSTSSSAYYWLIVPQILMVLSMLLVSMTALEFICAQAPQTMQGLLIGIWYAMYSIKYIIIAVQGNFLTTSSSWYLCQGCKVAGTLVSLLVYTIAVRKYKNRERDEVVNIQQMIEDVHERNLNLCRQMEEQHSLLDEDTANYSNT